MKIILETDRLILREFTMEDASLLFSLNSDPEVVRFTTGLITTQGQAGKLLEESIIPQYRLYGHGRWAVHAKSDNQFIGYCGLKTRPELQEVDLGYRFARKAWGKGYASEAAFACLRYGFEKLGLTRITARANHANQASIRVLEKCGMEYTGEDLVGGLPVKAYEARASRF